MANHSYDLDDICIRIARGVSLNAVAADYFVDESSLRQWLRKDEERSARYDQARIERTHRYADEIAEIADEVVGQDMTAIAAARLRIDTRKWIAGKLYPKMYGERVHTEHSGEITLASALKALDGK